MPEGLLDTVSVYDVFTPTTQARVNFVPRRGVNDSLVAALRTPGKQVIVYGESGSGKSTLLQRKLEELYPAQVTTRCTAGMTFEQILLNAFDQLGPYYLSGASSSSVSRSGGSLSAEFAGIKAAADASREQSDGRTWSRAIPPQLTVQRLGEFMGAAGRCWLLEDFHKVDPEQKTPLAQAMKVFSDLAAEYRDLKLIAVGATDTAREVVDYDPEMRHRIAEVLVPLMTDDELAAIVDGGSALLNVNLTALRTPFVKYSMGVAAVCHQLSLNACFNEGIFETQAVPFEFSRDQLEGVLEKWVSDSSDTVKAKFDAALRRHRVRRFDNTRLILGALAVGPLEGMLHADILAEIRKAEPDYPGSNLTIYLRELMTDQRGALVIASPDGRFRFVDPLHHTYAKAALQSSGRGQARTYYLDTSLAFDSAVVFTQLLDLSRTWSISVDPSGATEGETPPSLEVERRRTRSDES